MRTNDLAPPELAPHPRPPDTPAAAWPGQLVIGLERLPQAAYVWDDDDPAVVWDAMVPTVRAVVPATVATVATESGPSMGTANAIPAPAGVAIDDLLLAVIVGNPPGTPITFPAAWTQLRNVDNGSTLRLVVIGRIADGTADDLLTISGSGTADYCALIMRVTGHGVTDVATDLPAITTFTVGSAPDPPALDAGTAQPWLWIAAATFATTSTGQDFTATPANYTVAATIQSANATNGCDLSVAYRGLDAQTENPAAFTLASSKNWIAATVAVPPAVPSEPAYVWDAPEIGAGFTDTWCDFQGLEVTHGEPDEHELYPPSHATLQLRDPGDGRYRKRTADGRLVFYAPGRRLAVWWLDGDDEPWWIFSGRVATWREQLDGTVLVEAFSAAAELAQPIGAAWSAGTAGDDTRERLTAIAALADYDDPIAAWSDDGDTPLTVPPAEDRAPLEAMQQAAWSDGGIVFPDADDQLVTRDRRWRNGRADQTVVPVLTDNVCVGGAVAVWEPESTDADDGVAGTVVLTNVAGLTATASSADPWVDRRMRYSHPDVDLWADQSYGDGLAAWLVSVRSVARMALSSAQLYLHDTRHPELFTLGTDLRLTDRVTWLHGDADTTAMWGLVVRTIRHAVVPDGWVVEIETGPAVDHVPLGLWDQSRFTWDDPNPANVWS